MAPQLTTACTRPPTRWLSYTFRGSGGRVMPGVMCLHLGMVMKPIEETFVANFVRKSRRERASFELGSESRRGRFLNRLCHDFAGVFDAFYLRPLSESEDAAGLRKLLEKLGAKKTC